jgi:hypothetical protein
MSSPRYLFTISLNSMKQRHPHPPL